MTHPPARDPGFDAEREQYRRGKGAAPVFATAALIACAAGHHRQNPTDMRAALSMVRDAFEEMDQLPVGGHSTIAGRLAGAFRNIGRDQTADEIVETMRTVEYDTRENDPFEIRIPFILPARAEPPYVNRIRLMWREIRESMIDRFPLRPVCQKIAKPISSVLRRFMSWMPITHYFLHTWLTPEYPVWQFKSKFLPAYLEQWDDTTQ